MSNVITPAKVRRKLYDDAVEWIAHNDEPTITDVEEMAGIISVVLIADLFGKTPAQVARAVIKIRKEEQ